MQRVNISSFFLNKFIFEFIAIEKMTAKTGSFKSFDVFVNMLEDAIHQVGRRMIN